MSHSKTQQARQVVLVAKQKAHHDDPAQPDLDADEKKELAKLIESE